MPSPFPGMDPYLEGDLWPEFHERLAGAISAQLLRTLPRTHVALLETRTHLTEIDPLRRGSRVRLVGAPPAPYYVYLSRTQRRPLTAVWPVLLRERLPTVPVPLLAPDPDVPLNPQLAVDDCFALVGYERLLNYTGPPPPPPLPPEDAAWLNDVLTAAGYRR